MAKKKRPTPIEELVVPPQNHHICGTICVCQMTAILSSVALVYLSMAIYFPSMRTFYSGVIEQPFMCTTSKVVIVDKCTWGSCGEWCLSKTSGACAQIYVNLRENGTSLQFRNCSNTYNRTCYGIDENNVKRYHCKQEECKNLSGTYNCTAGTCIGISDVFDCVFHKTGEPLNCTGVRGKIHCMDIDGLNSCAKGICAKIHEPYNCDRRCSGIPTRNKNVILLSGDRVYVSQCADVAVEQADTMAAAANSLAQLQSVADGNETAPQPATAAAPPTVPWNASERTALMASCYTVEGRPDQVLATDCVNGTVVTGGLFPDVSNFTFLHAFTVAHEGNRTFQERQIAPLETDLLIANDSRLLINLEGCVNTLRDECRQFIKEYGKDGADHNARARFPCFYSAMDASLVVARFNMDGTYREFLPAIIVPASLLVVSCFTLILCQRTVEVGDDAKMRFKRRSRRATVAQAGGAAADDQLRETHAFISAAADDVDDSADHHSVNL
ncbi:hypothetical protein V9T40_007337 [Parthenolecanium corni]|uniref:Uncharacterized protein n=1 Tax=Parthenolecanium corni TaxID=536013 RepID=A0AAN9YBI7_9HEMI